RAACRAPPRAFPTRRSSDLRDHLGVAAAGRPTLHAEDRAEARLAQRDDDLLAAASQRVGESNRERGFALSGRRRADAGHEYEAARLAVAPCDNFERDLRLVMAVRDDLVTGQTEFLCDRTDGL